MIVNASITPAGYTTAQIAAETAIPLVRQIIYNLDNGKYAIGDGVTALNALTFYGGISASGLTVGTTTITGGTTTRVLYNNAGVVGEYAISGTGSVLMTSTIGSTVQGYSASTTLLGNSTTGSGSNIVLGTSPTFGGKVEIGVGATGIATTFSSLRVGVNNGLVDFGSIATGYSTIWLGQATPSASNYSILMTGSTALTLQASATVGLSQNQGTHSLILGAGTLTISDTTLNLVFGTTTGSKIGTATTQKIGFWNATPVVKQTVTGSRGGNAALADLLTKLATIGLLTDSTTA